MKFFLITGLFFSAFLLWNCSENKKKSSKDLILGEWIEVRRDNRGHIGFDHEPSVTLTFNKDGSALFSDRFIDEINVKKKYRFINDSTLSFVGTNEIKMINSKELILVFKYKNDGESDLDCFYTFLRKEVYEKLSKDEILKYQELTPEEKKEKHRRDSIQKTMLPLFN